MKLTKQTLKDLIKEELTKDEEDKKEELEGELKDLEHQWTKKAKLSSALKERYSISDENEVGTVLWHSLNEKGGIGVYDMQFGDTIVRNLLAEDIEPTIVLEHKHMKRDDDTKRN